MKKGEQVFAGLPARTQRKVVPLTDDVIGVIDELSGLNAFVDKFVDTNALPDTVKTKLTSQLHRYNGERPKEEVLHEIRDIIFGTGR